jgi:hypothetical protein
MNTNISKYESPNPHWKQLILAVNFFSSRSINEIPIRIFVLDTRIPVRPLFTVQPMRYIMYCTASTSTAAMYCIQSPAQSCTKSWTHKYQFFPNSLPVLATSSVSVPAEIIHTASPLPTQGLLLSIHRKKRLATFPSPAGMSLRRDW